MSSHCALLRTRHSVMAWPRTLAVASAACAVQRLPAMLIRATVLQTDGCSTSSPLCLRRQTCCSALTQVSVSSPCPGHVVPGGVSRGVAAQAFWHRCTRLPGRAALPQLLLGRRSLPSHAARTHPTAHAHHAMATHHAAVAHHAVANGAKFLALIRGKYFAHFLHRRDV